MSQWVKRRNKEEISILLLLLLLLVSEACTARLLPGMPEALGGKSAPPPLLLFGPQTHNKTRTLRFPSAARRTKTVEKGSSGASLLPKAWAGRALDGHLSGPITGRLGGSVAGKEPIQERGGSRNERRTASVLLKFSHTGIWFFCFFYFLLRWECKMRDCVKIRAFIPLNQWGFCRMFIKWF